MKCGRELKNQQVFCERCLAEMKDYPVKPNTVVQLPSRRPAPPAKKSHRKPEMKPEDQIRQLRARIHWLLILLVIILLMLAIALNFLMFNPDRQQPGQEIGSNYTTQK